MLFGTSQRLSSTKDPDNFEMKVCDDVVERAQVFKFLGVYMDINLNWHTHVEKIAKKIFSKIGILRLVKPFLTIDLSKTMFNVMAKGASALGKGGHPHLGTFYYFDTQGCTLK